MRGLIAAIAGGAVLAAVSAWAQEDAAGKNDQQEMLDRFIQQNVKHRGLVLAPLGAAPQTTAAAVETYAGRPVRLWTHYRNADQGAAVEAISDIFAQAVMVEGALRPVEQMAVQQVAAGPRRPQIRVFKTADRTTAEAMRDRLSEAGQEFDLLDLTAEYQNAAWVDPGHIELWLAPPG